MRKRHRTVLAGFLVLVFLAVSLNLAAGQGVSGDKAGIYQPPRPGGGSAAGYKFVGSKSTKEYHWPVCKLAKIIKPEDRVTFKSAQEAQAAGYTHCKVCSKFRF